MRSDAVAVMYRAYARTRPQGIAESRVRTCSYVSAAFASATKRRTKTSSILVILDPQQPGHPCLVHIVATKPTMVLDEELYGMRDRSRPPGLSGPRHSDLGQVTRAGGS